MAKLDRETQEMFERLKFTDRYLRNLRKTNIELADLERLYGDKGAITIPHPELFRAKAMLALSQ